MKAITNYFSKDIGIDLGTANTLVYVKGKGVVLREPSVVAMRKDDGTVLAVGKEAKNMIGRTPGNIAAIRPMKDGVIADFDVTQAMLKHFINKAYRRKSVLRPRVMICVPSGVTEVEKRAVLDATNQAGAREAHLIEETMGAAIGAGLPVEEATGSMIADIGGGTTEVAIISLGGIVTSESIRLGGDEMDEEIIQYLKKKYNLLIGERTAEEIKMTIGHAYLEQYDEMEIKGRDLVSGLPKHRTITAEEISEALHEPISNIIETIKLALEKTPPELSSDVMDKGIVLTGGGSLLKGMTRLIANETGMPVMLAESPLDSVVIGAGIVLDNMELLEKVTMNSKKIS